MTNYKWVGKDTLRYKGKSYFPSDVIPDGIDDESIKTLLKIGKIEKVSVDKPKTGMKGDKK